MLTFVFRTCALWTRCCLVATKGGRIRPDFHPGPYDVMSPNAPLDFVVFATEKTLEKPRAALQEMPDTRQGEQGGAPEL